MFSRAKQITLGGIVLVVAAAIGAASVAAAWSMGRVRFSRQTPLAPGAEPELKTLQGGKTQYYLSLPNGWTSDKSWPILVTIDGSGHTFRKNSEDFIKARKDLPFILVTPCVTSNGNDPEETKAVLAMVHEVQRQSHGQPKFFVTGFSAGCHLAWQLVLMHPEILAGAAPAAGNFLGRCITAYSDAPERVQLPIQAFQGDKDWHIANLNKQWDNASRVAAEHGYRNVHRTVVAGAPHEAFPEQVIAFCVGVIDTPVRSTSD